MSLSEDSIPQEMRLDLWKYFNDRKNRLKDVLLQVLSWLLAFALAILGFDVQKNMVVFENGLFTVGQANQYAVGTFSVIGILLCIYCFYLIYAYSVIINDNWVAAGRVRDELGIISEIYSEKPGVKKNREDYQELLESKFQPRKKISVAKNVVCLPSFCKKIGIAVFVFSLIFVLMLVNAVC